MTSGAVIAAWVMAGVLLSAAVEKARNLAPLVATLAELGLPRRLARPAAAGVTATEITVAVAVLFRPDSAPTQAGIAALAVLFALAGLLAIAGGKPIRCSCFGAGSGGYLGRPQLLALVPWLGGVVVLRIGAGEAPPLEIGAASFAAVSLAVAATRMFAAREAQGTARGDRLSAQEMYRWLRSH